MASIGSRQHSAISSQQSVGNGRSQQIARGQRVRFGKDPHRDDPHPSPLPPSAPGSSEGEGVEITPRSSRLDDWPRHLINDEAVYSGCYDVCRIDTTSLSVLVGTWLHTYWSLIATLESTVSMPLPPLYQRTAEEFGRGVIEVLKKQAEVTPGVARLLLRFVEKFLPYIDWQVALAHCEAEDCAEAEENYERIIFKDPVFLPVIDLRSLKASQRPTAA